MQPGSAEFEAAYRHRLPGEQWVILDSAASAEAYLASYQGQPVRITRVEQADKAGLYASIQHLNRIVQDRVYIAR